MPLIPDMGVIRAWYEGRACYSDTFSTDGNELKHFNHLIGYTNTVNGIHYKIVADCHESSITERFISSAMPFATKVVKCELHPSPLAVKQTVSTSNQNPQTPGTKDGAGYGDNDKPYTFGRRISVGCYFPFTEREFARLMLLRIRVQNGELRGDTEV